jgi:hypothetical protein
MDYLTVIGKLGHITRCHNLLGRDLLGKRRINWILLRNIVHFHVERRTCDVLEGIRGRRSLCFAGIAATSCTPASASNRGPTPDYAAFCTTSTTCLRRYVLHPPLRICGRDFSFSDPVFLSLTEGALSFARGGMDCR